MNKDDDPRFLPNGDWIDALNLSSGGEQGYNGSLSAALGNERLNTYDAPTGTTAYFQPSGVNTVIGSVDDELRGFTYYFVHNSNGNHQLMRYVYDQNVSRLVWEDNSYDQSYNPYNADYQGVYSSTTAYTNEDIVSDSGSFYRCFRADYKVECGITAAAPNTLTIGTHYYKTGDLIQYNDNGGSVGGLTNGDFYFVIRISSTTIQLADTFVDALNSTNVTFAGSVSGSPSVEDPKGLTNDSVWKDLNDTLNLNSNFLITHALVTEWNGRVYLLWTDNNEQPSIMEVTDGRPTTNQYPYLERKFLDLYAFQPHHPPTASYGSDSNVDQNNTALKALQFRYAWKFKDGRTTVMSPISRIPMPTVSNYGDIQDDNKVVMQIPVYHGDTSGFVEEVYLYVKTNGDNNTGDWYLAETFDVSEETVIENPSPYSDRYLWYIAYDFFNTSTLSPIARTIQDQIQDFIPLKSATMTQAGNGRCLLGNNLDGFDFDTSTLDVTLEAITQNSGLSTTDPPESGFKKTCRYPIGIVYGDRNGRLSTVYRNKDMVFKSPYWSSSNLGSVQCKMSIGHAPPSWAEFWMPVYAGNQTMDYWVQSAISAVSSPNLTLKDLFDYNGANTDSGYNYTFQDNQRLRVIYDESAGALMGATNGDVTVRKGSNFVLTLPFGGFSTNPANDDMVEVYRLKQATAEDDEVIWYEMGWSFKIETDQNGNKVHGGTNSFTNGLAECQSQVIDANPSIAQDCIIVLDQADCYVRYMDDVESTASSFKSVEFKDLFPFKESDIHTIGRPNVLNPNYEQSRREQEIVFSEPLVDNTDFFGINRFFDISFNDSLNNAYGDLTVMHSNGDELLCVQETKAARMLANKNFIYTGDLQNFNIQSNVFLSEPQYFSQEYGCQNPESFDFIGGVSFWVDKERGKYLRSFGGTLETITPKMDSYFRQNLTDTDATLFNNNPILGCYSKYDNSYFTRLDTFDRVVISADFISSNRYTVNFNQIDIDKGIINDITSIGFMYFKQQDGQYPLVIGDVVSSTTTTVTVDVTDITTVNPKSINTDRDIALVPKNTTISFDNNRGRWISRHAFNPEWMCQSGESIISFSSGLAYRHSYSTYLLVVENVDNWAYYSYDLGGSIYVDFPFNQEGNRVKEPICINIDVAKTEAQIQYIMPYMYNDNNQVTESDLVADFVTFEGKPWSYILRDKTTPVVSYPLLEGDYMKGCYHVCRISTTGSQLGRESISAATLKYNNSNIT